MSADGKEMIDTLSKLDRIKDIRNRTMQVYSFVLRKSHCRLPLINKILNNLQYASCSLQLDKMKSKIRDEFRQSEFEAKSLTDYKAELEQLVQEKMAHVEELRLIHADINMMESIIKQVNITFCREHTTI